MRIIAIPTQSLDLFIPVIKRLIDEGIEFSVTVENKQFVITLHT